MGEVAVVWIAGRGLKGEKHGEICDMKHVCDILLSRRVTEFWEISQKELEQYPPTPTQNEAGQERRGPKVKNIVLFVFCLFINKGSGLGSPH